MAGSWQAKEMRRLVSAIDTFAPGVREVGDLDAYLGQAAHESPFIRARQKLTSTLKGFSDSHSLGRR